MTEGDVGLLIGGALILLLMPTSLSQFGQKRRQVKGGQIKDAMLKRAPDTSVKPRLLLIGAGLAAVWIAVWLIVLAA